MKKYILSFSVLMFFLITNSYGFTSKIDKVTMYKNSALVTRIVTMPAGNSTKQVKIAKLPYSIDNNSIQILSTPDITVNSFDVKTVYAKTNENVTLRTLREKMKKMKLVLMRYNNHMNVLSEKRKFLDAVRQSFSLPDRGDKKTNFDWKSAYRFFGISIDSLLSDSLRTAMKIGDVESQIKELQEKINQFAPLNENHKTLFINMEKTGNKSGTITIKYIVRNVGWKPFYRLDINNLQGKYELSYLAKIRQNSGEDWDNVKLTVSTSAPEIPSVATHVSPWYLYPYAPKRASSKSMMYRESDKVASTPAAGKNISSPQINENLYSVSFTLPRRVTIPSVKSEKTVYLASISGRGKLSLFASPIVSKYVYAHMDFVNDNKFPLLPGNTDILWNGDYNGKAYIPFTSPKDSVSIECGVDKGVIIKRELVEHKFDKGNVMSKNKSYYFKYRTEIRNGHGRKVKIVVEDRIPVSKDKNIKVVGAKISPKDYQLDENGIIKFSLNIPAKKEMKLFVEYKIVIPKGINANGLF